MKKRITARELMAKLNADPEHLAYRAARDAEIAAREAVYRAAEQPLVDELRAAGFDVDSAWDLIPRAEPYPEALPILLKHLQLDYPAAVTEGIARAFATRASRFGWDVVVRLFREEQRERAKDGLAVALSAMTGDDCLEPLIALCFDRALGPSRLLLLRALERSRSPRATEVLRQLAEDPDLCKEVPVILKKHSRRKR